MSQTYWNIARVFYGLPLCLTGLIYLLKPQGTVETLVSFIPGGLSLIYLFGFFWVLLGASISLNYRTRYAYVGVILLIAVNLVIIHIPAVYTGQHLHIVWFELLRNVSLMAGAFLFYLFESKRQKDTSSCA